MNSLVEEYKFYLDYLIPDIYVSRTRPSKDYIRSILFPYYEEYFIPVFVCV
jgi:hypothetical protein